MKLLSVCAASILVMSSLVGRAGEPTTAISFNRDIRPILSENCFYCHGQDPNKRKAGMRLDVREEAMKVLKSGETAIVPGKVDKSAMIARILSTDVDEQMPPPKSGRTLTAQQKDKLKRWIAEGAKYEAHWAFVAPKSPALPEVKDNQWIRNPVDRFILATLEQNGLKPSLEADRNTLIRRLTLDLTGLPPTPKEADEFAHDTSDKAYEKVVDRLLKSQSFGERMAQPWLDAARYADTNGYQSDGERSMWRWRDWVIEAFNNNMPFDQFTIEQLAGDLLPHATMSQRLATGFNRNHRGNAEGGIVPEEFAVEYVVDRVDTTATVWMGLTMGCARCHDHKYDPVTQRDFYQMSAFFNNVPEKGKAIKIGNSPPVMVAPTAHQSMEVAALEQQVKRAEDNLRKLEPEISAAQSAWEHGLKGEANVDWSVTDGLQAKFGFVGNLDNAKFEGGPAAFAPGHHADAAVLDGKCFINCGDVGDFGFFDKFTLAAWIRPDALDGAIISRMVEQPEDSAFASDSEGYRVHLKSGHVQFHLTKRWLDDALRVETEEAIPAGQWQHVAVVYDGSRLASGVKIYLNGQPQKLRVLLDQLNQTFQTKQPLRIGAGGGPANRFKGMVSDVRVFKRALWPDEVGIAAQSDSVTKIATIPAAQRTAFQAAKLRSCYLNKYATVSWRESADKVATLRDQRALMMEGLPTVMVMEEMPKPRDTFILKRGEYDKPGERVTANVPASLPSLPADAPKNRLAFAKWLVSPAHPLTARVAVNHQWQMLFGTGLVKTTEDFGSQGEPPSHPELLDWLATNFMRSGWDMKALIKTLVMSATYRQSSKITPELLARDPENRLLARGSRLRLPAEMIRDQALAASGLMVSDIGGPSVKPYQPAGLLKELTGTDYEPDHGDKLWRRSLYTFWKRTSPQPTMMTFDAAGREMCSVRPSRTSTPLQALALMNDVTYIEAARRLAERVIKEAEVTPEERLKLAFRLVLVRPPKASELQVLMDELSESQKRFSSHPEAAQALVNQGEAKRDPALNAAEVAAYASVAGLIMNLDEAITKP